MYGDIDACGNAKSQRAPRVSFPSWLVTPGNRTTNKILVSSSGKNGGNENETVVLHLLLSSTAGGGGGHSWGMDYYLWDLLPPHPEAKVDTAERRRLISPWSSGLGPVWVG